jgi:glucokinase
MTNVAIAKEELLSLIEDILRANREISDRIAGIGIAITGTWNLSQQTLIFSPTLPQWQGLDLRQFFRTLPYETILVDNDAKAAAIAELSLGAGRQYDDFLFLYGDYGIGSALVHKRKIVRGQDNLGGGVGHALVSSDPHWPVCTGCRRRGCIGAYANTKVIAEKLEADPFDRHVLEEVAGYLAIALANILNQFCPQAMVVGGKLFSTYSQFYPALVQMTRQQLLDHIVQRVVFMQAECEPNLTLIGMAMQVFDQVPVISYSTSARAFTS